ncbi:MAG: EF-P beta-lysylation protein EpmB [Halomonadaceae bacterium]|nr:MAG: EF-P beta-lysylation protein EpmB [Halomonadaceae bacterium]
MIQRTPALIEARNTDAPASWQKILAQAITEPRQLLQALALPESLLAGMEAGHQRFGIRVPAPYLARIRKGDAHDPLLRQVLPLQAETTAAPGFFDDPLAEQDSPASLSPGLIRKYRSRALLIVSGACAINCRYCFRRHYPYAEQQLGVARQAEALAHIRQDPAINEVIFSGGDPLTLNDRQLGRLARELAAMPQIRRLRIHTRLPVVIPQRVNEELLAWLEALPVPMVMVLHINHPREIDPQVHQAMEQLRAAGVTLLNQAVLLRGVNDDADTLEALSEALFAAGILPYYLHGFDAVADAAHFDAGDHRARELMRELLIRLPGFLVPKLVREVPGQASKWPLDLGLLPV